MGRKKETVYYRLCFLVLLVYLPHPRRQSYHNWTAAVERKVVSCYLRLVVSRFLRQDYNYACSVG